MKLVSIYTLLHVFPCKTFMEKEKYHRSLFHCLNSNHLLFLFCSLNKYHNELREYYITLGVNVGARVMLTTHIDVSDGLTHGAMGTVADIITEQITGEMKAILVEFDNYNVGYEAMCRSLYTYINQNAVPIKKVQACFL